MKNNKVLRWIPPIKPQLIEVAEGDLTLDEFMSLLSDEDMARLLGGQPNRGVAGMNRILCHFGSM